MYERVRIECLSGAADAAAVNGLKSQSNVIVVENPSNPPTYPFVEQVS